MDSAAAREIGRIVISLFLLGLATTLFCLGVRFPEPSQALGFGAVGGTIVGALITYWLKAEPRNS